MEVILKEDIRALGKAGEVVRVSEGYGRNYLLPQRKAIPATEGNLKKLESEKKSLEGKRARLKEEAEALAERIKNLTVTLEREAGEEDKLFGSVTTRQVAEALTNQGISLDHRNLRFKETIRKTGSYVVEVYLHGDVASELKLEVKKK